MTTRNSKPSLLYTHGTPVRWLEAAVAMLDDRLANLCARQWQCAQQVALDPARALRSHRRTAR
jgi:hypothetical protein